MNNLDIRPDEQDFENATLISSRMDNATYVPSRTFLSCTVHGFTYWDGLNVIDDLIVGTCVELRAEPSNPYDPKAVAIWLNGSKIGYIPRHENTELSMLLFFGHSEVFEAFINQINWEVSPEHQVGIVVRVKDARRQV